MDYNVRIGIIQGRLSKPTNGFQECPRAWEREFDLLPRLELEHVEWIITKKSFENNPFFTENLFGFSIESVCADNLVDTRIHDRKFLNNNLVPICDAAIRNGVKNITIPLLEDSDLSDGVKRKEFSNSIVEIGEVYDMLNFSFEIESLAHVIKDIIYLRNNFYLTYDTGNMTTMSVDHISYLSMFYDKINNIHLKDRNEKNETTIPGQGSTNFEVIFALLKSRGYQGTYTLQTAREESGKEIETICKHKRLLEDMYAQSF